MKLFTIDRDYSPGTYTPDAMFVFLYEKSSTAKKKWLIGCKLRVPMWWDWEIQDYGRTWVFGQKYLYIFRSPNWSNHGRSYEWGVGNKVKTPVRRVLYKPARRSFVDAPPS